MTGFYHKILKFPELGPDIYLTEQVGAAMVAGEAIVGDFINRQPWFVRDKVPGNGNVDAAQAQLNRHGMTPGNGHRRSQQHPIVSGLAGQVWLGVSRTRSPRCSPP